MRAAVCAGDDPLRVLHLDPTDGATGVFRTGKVGTRWVLVTPAGNAFWMRGVYDVTGDDHVACCMCDG